MNIYVGNITYSATEDDLKNLFQQHGEVTDVRIITDKFTQLSKGFGFVEMADDNKANAAIEALNGADFMGRPLKVNVARDRRESY